MLGSKSARRNLGTGERDRDPSIEETRPGGLSGVQRIEAPVFETVAACDARRRKNGKTCDSVRGEADA